MSLAEREVERASNPNSPASPASVDGPWENPARRRRGLQLEEWLAIAVLAAVLGLELLLIRVGVDAQDEGYFLEQASRALRGDLPYRDFDTLYTPGILYLHAAVLGLVGGPHVFALRAVGFLARVVLSGGLYVLCRPLVRPAFAVLPAVYVIVGLDRVPLTWEPHPGWPSAAITIVAVCAFAQLPGIKESHRRSWLVGIGAATAVVFAFKQNAGVFLGLALVVFTAWQGLSEGGAAVTRWLRATQILLLLGLVAATGWLIRPHASPAIAAYFLVPMVTVGIAALRGITVSSAGRSLGSWLAVVAYLGLGYLVVTVPWMAALTAALDGRLDLLKGFVGAVDQDVLWSPLEGPTGSAWASLVGCAVAVVAAVRVRQHRLLLVGCVAAFFVFATCCVLLTAQPDETAWFAVSAAPERAAEHLPVLLPLVSILLGAWWAFRSPPSFGTWRLRWMTVAATVTLLTEYPRVDDVHLAWSACLAVATGAVVVGQIYGHLVERWNLGGVSRAVLMTALVAVPAATTLPDFPARFDGLVGTSGVARLWSVTDLPAVNGLLVTDEQSTTLVDAARYVRARTAPGEPIFVYPASPLLYLMTDRPNPTRYAHLYPGAVSPDGVRGVIASLQNLPVRLTIVAQTDLSFWGPAVGAKPLEDFLARNYQEVARFGEYRVLLKAGS